MAWKLTKDLSHPMWGGTHFTPRISKWPSIKELALPPKPPAPPGFTYIWKDAVKKGVPNKPETPLDRR